MDFKQNEKKLSFVLYQEEKSPQYFEIKKNFLKFIFVAFPITLILLIFFIVVGTIYLRKIKNLGTVTGTTTIQAKQPIQTNEKEYLKQIQMLEERLNKPAEGLSSLGLFKQIKGQLDLSKKPMVAVEGISNSLVDGKTQLQFTLNNITDSNKKISGHLFVVVKNQNSLKVFPENAILEGDFQVNYNKGEKFSFNRLRPFAVTFNDGKISKNLNFKILVFSPTGDLLFDKNYSIGKN
jgi:hypothetical protein